MNWMNKIVESDKTHRRWLNTLSYMESIGAKLIMSRTVGRDSQLDVLQHAQEEARHAWFLKKQLDKIKMVEDDLCSDYSNDQILGGQKTKNYLHRLELHIVRILRDYKGLTFKDIKKLTYLLTTYTIEIRAEKIYGHYQSVLNSQKSKVSVQLILKEEEEHLAMMEREMNQGPLSAIEMKDIIESCLNYENELYNSWKKQILEIL